MKIYSWNVLFSNTELDRAFDFISHAPFDIFCLQEVPEALLSRLKTLPVSIAVGKDSDREVNGNTERIYLVTLSKYPIRRSDTFDLPVPHAPLRTRLFGALMRPIMGWSHIYSRGGMQSEVETPLGMFRVYCIHLLLAHPSVRADGFERATRGVDPSRQTIICGDFNTLESWRIALLNWILGGSVMDTLHVMKERPAMETRFIKLGLQNPLKGNPTHGISASQLDHILVPRGMRVAEKQVISDRIGSDHHPIFIDLQA